MKKQITVPMIITQLLFCVFLASSWTQFRYKIVFAMADKKSCNKSLLFLCNNSYLEKSLLRCPAEPNREPSSHSYLFARQFQRNFVNCSELMTRTMMPSIGTRAARQCLQMGLVRPTIIINIHKKFSNARPVESDL